MGDDLNIQKITALSKVAIFTPEYHSDKLISLIQQDIFAFEVLCYKLFYKTNKLDRKNPPFMNYKCHMIEYIRSLVIENQNLDDLKHASSITFYREMLHKIFVLPKNASISDENEMRKRFQVYLIENGEMTDNNTE